MFVDCIIQCAVVIVVVAVVVVVVVVVVELCGFTKRSGMCGPKNRKFFPLGSLDQDLILEHPLQ